MTQPPVLARETRVQGNNNYSLIKGVPSLALTCWPGLAPLLKHVSHAGNHSGVEFEVTSRSGGAECIDQ